MDDAQADETRADGATGDDTRREAQAGEAQAGGGPDAAKLRRLRLSGFLRELVRAEGRMEAAELLGVAYRTLVRAEESGEISGRMNDALERLLGTGDDPEVARLRASIGTVEERMASLEAGLETLAEELRDGLDGIRAAAPGGPEDEAEDGIAGENAAARDAGDRADGAGVPPVAGLSPGPPFTERRSGPGGGDRGSCRRRPSGLWRGVAAGRRVARAAGRSPRRGREPFVAGDPGAAARGGAGDAGRPRADAASGDPAAEGLCAPGTDTLAPKGAGRHTAGAGQTQAPAVGLPPGSVAAVDAGPGGLLHRGDPGAEPARAISVDSARRHLIGLPYTGPSAR